MSLRFRRTVLMTPTAVELAVLWGRVASGQSSYGRLAWDSQANSAGLSLRLMGNWASLCHRALVNVDGAYSRMQSPIDSHAGGNVHELCLDKLKSLWILQTLSLFPVICLCWHFVW